jgi:hypothetical protein
MSLISAKVILVGQSVMIDRIAPIVVGVRIKFRINLRVGYQA